MNNIEARIKRNNFKKYAGEFFRNKSSKIILELSKKDDTVICGISDNEKVYTIISKEYIYYKTKQGIADKVRIEVFLKQLQEQALTCGKDNKFTEIKLEKNVTVWVLNTQTMNAIWNTLLFLTKKNYS